MNNSIITPAALVAVITLVLLAGTAVLELTASAGSCGMAPAGEYDGSRFVVWKAEFKS